MGQAWSRLRPRKTSADNNSSSETTVADIGNIDDDDGDDGASDLPPSMAPNSSASARVHRRRTDHQQMRTLEAAEPEGPLPANYEEQTDDIADLHAAGDDAVVLEAADVSSAPNVSTNLITTFQQEVTLEARRSGRGPAVTSRRASLLPGISVPLSAVATSDDDPPVASSDDLIIHRPGVLSWTDRQAIIGPSRPSEDLSEEQKEAAAALRAEVDALNAKIRELEAMEVWQTKPPAQSSLGDQQPGGIVSTGAPSAVDYHERPSLNINNEPPSLQNASSSIEAANASKKKCGQSVDDDGREYDADERRPNASALLFIITLEEAGRARAG